MVLLLVLLPLLPADVAVEANDAISRYVAHSMQLMSRAARNLATGGALPCLSLLSARVEESGGQSNGSAHGSALPFVLAY